MAIATRSVWRESRANSSRLSAKRTAERRSTSRGVTPFVANTFWDRLGSFRSVEAPAQSLKLKTCATSRKLATTKSDQVADRLRRQRPHREGHSHEGCPLEDQHVPIPDALDQGGES